LFPTSTEASQQRADTARTDRSESQVIAKKQRLQRRKKL